MEIILSINNGKNEIKLFIDDKRKVYNSEFLDVAIIEIYQKEKDIFGNFVNINDYIQYFNWIIISIKKFMRKKKYIFCNTNLAKIYRYQKVK